MRRPLYSFIIDPELRAGIRRVKVRDGISESEQIRRGIRLWLKQQGVAVKTERQRGSRPRRRP